MLYADHRLSRTLSDIRLEQAEAIHRRHQAALVGHRRLSERLGHLLIAMGEKLTGKQARAA